MVSEKNEAENKMLAKIVIDFFDEANLSDKLENLNFPGETLICWGIICQNVERYLKSDFKTKPTESVKRTQVGSS